jgi:diguanylate cyclase (GGDEF)-like protein
VFRSGKLSHFVVLVVRLQDALSLANLRKLRDDGFDYSLERSNPDGNRPSLISRSTELTLRDPVTVAIAAPGSDWKLSAVPRQGWRPAATGREAAVVTLASLLVALFVYDLLRRPERLEREVQVRAQRLVETNRRLMTEMTERERAEELARHEATHDQLTGLANRPHFLMRVARLQDRTDASSDFAYSVIVVNLDRFKSLNDSLGAAAADKVLIQVARRLEGALRPEDMVARVGGDEFAILLFDISDVLSVSHIASRIQDQLQRVCEIGGEEVFLTASMGIAFSATGYSEPEQPLRDAHLAMQSAKEEGGARQLIFDKIMRDQAITLSNIERELRPALERNEMRVFYQPIVSLETGRITGFEALIRWKHPQRGFITPGLFLPVAEATGLILQLDRWVLREAVREVDSLNQRGNQFSISVNLSGKQFSDAELGPVVERVLADSGLAPELLRLEITESVMMRNAQSTLRTLQELKTLNVKISLDDFGTGYSSLSYIREFPLDVLKIDRSFVSKMTENARDEEIVRVILGLAATLGLQVVAEGVETAEHLAQLRALLCDYGQGYLFAKPLDSEALASLLATNPRW